MTVDGRVTGVVGGLTGIRVIDFGQYVAGPLLGVMLANEGAEVVHVDPPGGPLWDHPSDAFLNRGKRRIVLDLKRDADRAVARRLVATADVVIENFRPGVMGRLGLGWDDVKALAPHVVYCSLPGFSEDDPRAALPGWEGVIAAATGDCWIRTGQEPEGWDTSCPTYRAVPVASNFAAFLAATSVVAALTARQRTGLGQRVEVPLFNAMFEVIGVAGAYISAEGMPPPLPLKGNGSGTYRCADGRFVQFNPIGSSARFVRWLVDLAGAGAWAAEGLTDGLRLAREPELAELLCARLRELFSTRTAQEWEELGGPAGVPISMVRTGTEWLGNPHAQASRAVTVVDDPELGPTAMAGLPVHTVTSNALTIGPRSPVDGDRERVLGDLEERPLPRIPVGEQAAIGRPYEGLRVVDLTEILAGPTSGRILGEFGADVVKINGVNTTVSAHCLLNRGKQSILLNVESERGQEVFWRLIEQADVVIQNYPKGTADRYGIGYEHVKARKPDIIYVSVSCYGYGGIWDGRRGYETQGQAVSGIMERAGGDYPPEVLGPYNVLDFGTGVMASFAASVAIYHRTVTGQGQHVTASLAQTGTYHQASYLLDYSGKDWDVPRGPATLGEGPRQRLYQTRDGWLFLGLKPVETGQDWQHPDLRRLSKTLLGEAPETLEAALEKLLASAPTMTWVTALQAEGVGAHEVVALPDLMVDPLVRGLGLSIAQAVGDVGEVTMPGIGVRLSHTPPRVGPVAPRPGSDAVSVLASVGLDNAAELHRAWVLRIDDLPPAWPRRA
jgi:crotonobetainyl-CoA:carnitine CoA-transferase CaiB-like acyl-CoA transferase